MFIHLHLLRTRAKLSLTHDEPDLFLLQKDGHRKKPNYFLYTVGVFE